MNIKLVNFELFFINSENQDPEIIASKNIEIIKKDLLEIDAEHVVGLLLLDGFLYKDNELFYKNMKTVQEYADEIGIKNITLMAGMCENFEHKLKENGINFDVEFFDYCQWLTWKSYENQSTEIHTWNPAANKFLFLGGIPSRPNRITLLKKFYDKDLLNFCEWSFYPPWTHHDKEWCRKSLHNLNDDEYNDFIRHCDRKIDDLYKEMKLYTNLNGKQLKEQNIFYKEWFQNLGYIDPLIYTNTCFSVISEGNAYPGATDFYFISEKTWRAVANNHPFIIAGYPEQVKYAQNRGLKIFNNYFLIKDYYLIEDENKRLDAIVTNTKYFMENYKNYESDILKDINHNYEILNEQININKKRISKYSIEDQITYFYQKDAFGYLIRIVDN